jgi:hypothetical protein
MLFPPGVTKLRKPSTAGFTASSTAANEVVVGGSLSKSSQMSEARETKRQIKHNVDTYASACIYCVCMQTTKKYAIACKYSRQKLKKIIVILTKLNDHRCDNAEGIRTPSFGVLHAQLNLW